jgi:hypothetical protein
MGDSALTLHSRNGSADWPALPGWQRLFLTTLIVCLPVPMLAASGLAVPLPSVVYRVAVGLAERTQAVAVGVPGFEAVVAETTETPRHGMIRLSAQERAAAASAGDAARYQDLAVGAAPGDGTSRPVAVAREVTATHSPRHPVRVGSAEPSEWTEEPQDSTSVASAEAVVAPPVTGPPAQQSGETQEDGPSPAPTSTAEGEHDRPSPPASGEPKGSPGDSSPRVEEPRSDAPQGGKTSDPPAASDTPSSGSVPETPPLPPVDTPEPGSRPVAPPDRTDTPDDKPNPGRPVTPPGEENKPDPVTPAPVDTPAPGSPPVTPPGESNGAGGPPEPPGKPEVPGAPRAPRTPGRPE